MKIIKEPKDGLTLDATDTHYPSILRVVGSPRHEKDPTQTTYGFVLFGTASLFGPGGFKAQLQEGCYYSAPGDHEVIPSDGGTVVAISRFGFRGQWNIGRIEKVGRLSYIDGCSDTILVPPPRLGDPCFNHLHFPPHVLQTQHTHPTIRMGIVAAGEGHAYQLATNGEGWEYALQKGNLFLLDPQEIHSFRTDKTKSNMEVVAFHPDSDWGPTDAVHPMRNRTYIGNAR